MADHCPDADPKNYFRESKRVIEIQIRADKVMEKTCGKISGYSSTPVCKT